MAASAAAATMADAKVLAISAIKRSPSTLQYHIPNTRTSKFYKPVFVFSPEDRAKTIRAEWFRKTDPMMPVYPYGRDVRYPEANEGLYGGMTVRSGNKISKGRNKGKTVRKWFPNVKVEQIKSKALGRELTIPIASRVMRTIKKVGGLDEYVTGEKPARIKELGLLGWKLRWMVINSKKFRSQYETERGKLVQSSEISLPNPLKETFEDAWNDGDKREALIRQQTEKWEALREKDERFKKDYQKNVVADRTKLKIPDISTLSIFDPVSLDLSSIAVSEDGVVRKLNDPSADVSKTR